MSVLDPTYFEVHRNYHPDPGFESGVFSEANLGAATAYPARASGDPAAWITKQGSVTSSIRVVTPGASGKYGLRVSGSAGALFGTATDWLGATWTIPTVPGDVWSAAALVGEVSSGMQGRLRIRFVDFQAGPVLVTLATYTADYSGANYQRLLLENLVAPSGSDVVMLSCLLREPTGSTAATGLNQAKFDDVLLTDGPVAVPTFDGDSGNARWLGVPHASPSERRGEHPDMDSLRAWTPPIWWELTE